MDIYQVGILERYAARPASLKDTYLSDFATSYNLTPPSSNETNDIESEKEEEEEVTSSKVRLCFYGHYWLNCIPKYQLG